MKESQTKLDEDSNQLLKDGLNEVSSVQQVSDEHQSQIELGLINEDAATIKSGGEGIQPISYQRHTSKESLGKRQRNEKKLQQNKNLKKVYRNATIFKVYKKDG